MMMLKRAAFGAGLLALTASCLGDIGPLAARQPISKRQTALLRVPEDATGRMIVKFVDSARVRAEANGRLATATDAPLFEVNDVLRDFGLTARPTSNKSLEALEELQARAEAYSGKAQPDLAGMMYIDGPRGTLLEAARALNDMDLLEWVSFERTSTIRQGEPVCGDAGSGDCFDLDGTGSPVCEDEPCCTFICQFLEFCCEVEWDGLCAAMANQFCDSPPADRCRTPFNESCFEAHTTAGCRNEDCCNIVCAIDDFCCLFWWDDTCVNIAQNECFVGGPNDPTPNLIPQQGYLRPVAYADQDGGDPGGLGYPAPDFDNFAGEGWNLYNDDYLLLEPEPDEIYDGLIGLSRELFEVYGIGETDPPDSSNFDDLVYNTRGRGAKVAVIEWAFYEDHEDLDVIIEPGQTLIVIPAVTEPDHATACLGIINAQENGFGMTGIAPEAQAYFFPLTSVEEGPRAFTAWLSALQTLGPGDVISCSYGPFPNLNCVEGMHTLIRLASDLGITVCVAAGNDCANLSDQADFGVSGAIVVGAGTPGRFYNRLTFSNFYRDGDPAVNGNVVHVQAWGNSVAATGYGDLFLPNDANGVPDKNRAYTGEFNGTSAACPQIAGLVACFQGLARQFYGIPMTPETMGAVIAHGFPQMGIPNPDDMPGFPQELNCGPDIDPDSEANKIGPYPTPAGNFGSASSFMLNQSGGGFDDSPRIDEIYLIRGQHILGNRFSVKGWDNSYYIIEGQYTDRDFQPGGPSGGGGGGNGNPTPATVPEIAQLHYLASGDITDIVALGHADISPVNTMSFYAVVAWTGVFTIELAEAYDWDLGRWSYLGAELMTEAPEEDADFTYEFPAAAPERFVRNSDDRILTRLWSLGFATTGGLGGSGGQQLYRQRIDLLYIDLEETFGELLPP